MATINLRLQNQQEADDLRNWLQNHESAREHGLVVREGVHDAVAADMVRDPHIQIEAADEAALHEALNKHFEARNQNWRDYQAH